MIETAQLQSFSVMKDDRDWLMELGRMEGESRLLRMASDPVKKLREQFRPSPEKALTLPWPMDDQRRRVEFVPGKVTIWSGPTFSGKTQFLRQLMLWAIKCRHKVLFASLEEEPLEVVREFVCMAALTRSPDKNLTAWALDWLDERLLVFDSTELVDPKILLGIVRFCAANDGVSHVVIDSLMRLNLRMDDYDGQRELGNLLSRVARVANVHLHLVAHPRKTQNSRTPMDLYDIRGAQDIVAQADSVVTLERNHDDELKYDNAMRVWKQRGEFNWIGELALFYDQDSRQLKYQRDARPIRFLPDEAYGGKAETNWWEPA